MRLRAAARLSALTIDGSDPAPSAVRLVAKLAALADAVSKLRKVQQHAAQAAAARRAAEQLHADLVRARSGIARPGRLRQSERNRSANAGDVIRETSQYCCGRIALSPSAPPNGTPTT